MNLMDRLSVGIGMASRTTWILFAGASARRRKTVRPLLTTVAVAGVAEVTSSMLRRWIGRERPCRTQPALIRCPKSSSLPSNHAAIAAASAVSLSTFEPHAKTSLLAFAALVAASRVRVGVHHTSDVVCGLALGGVVGSAAGRFGRH
jgi:membrane-associated phospholipid phosphatase